VLYTISYIQPVASHHTWVTSNTVPTSQKGQ